ncbi:unnamed protein product [Cuscuta epithymum]|uniref:Phosphatidic acid phosphatase type 2/haloperoxidase domain-containing protein n=1 Tax=Cuscuta epithymum TaxID=186058 RepID=A0AAV0FPA5_9ASTE|nr:unnamed protein product [Cuscuta epithymum]
MGSQLSPSLLRRVIVLDSELSLRLYSIARPIIPYYLLKALEISGDGRLFFPVIISLLLTTSAAGAFLINLLLAALLDLALIGLIKHIIQRPRPVYNKNMSLSFAVDHWSFPSGHSSRVFFIATMFYLSSHLMPTLIYVVGLWAIATSGSRVLLGRHFVLDVVAGACVGVLEGMFAFRFLRFENLTSFLFRPKLAEL